MFHMFTILGLVFVITIVGACYVVNKDAPQEEFMYEDFYLEY